MAPGGKPFPVQSTLFLALMLAIGVAHATTLISDADGSFVSKNLSPHMDYFVDRSGQMDFNRIQELPDAAWVPVRREVISFGFSEEIYWFRVNLRNASTATEFTLHAGNQTFDAIDVYHITDTGVVHHQTGFALPLSERTLNHHQLLVPMDIAAGSDASLIMRASTNGEFYLPLSLWERQAYFIADSQSGIWRGIAFGVWLMVLVSNLVIYAAVRHRSLLSYFAFAAAYGIYEFFHSEVGLGYLMVIEADFSRTVMVLSLALSIFSARLLASDLFEMSERHAPVLRILNWLSWGALATALSYVYFSYATVMTVQKALLIPVATLILVTGFREVVAGNRLAVYSISVWGLLLTGLIVGAAGDLQWLPVTPITEAIAPIGFSLMMLTLGFALTTELNRRSKDSHTQLMGANQEQREINQQLEAMVRERTEKLEHALAELSDANESLKELNTVDALTSIKNRQYFDTIFEQEWRRATRQKYPLSLLLLDIDHFKRVNDTFGHLAGDECLRIFARTVSDLLRRPADIVARYGGEEFVVLLPYVENDNAVTLAEQIRTAIADRTIDTSDERINITCSIGVSTVEPREGDDRKDALAAADIALYEAKASGRNRVSNAGNLSPEPEVRENQSS